MLEGTKNLLSNSRYEIQLYLSIISGRRTYKDLKKYEVDFFEYHRITRVKVAFIDSKLKEFCEERLAYIINYLMSKSHNL